jgi:hypothetical protein
LLLNCKDNKRKKKIKSSKLFENIGKLEKSPPPDIILALGKDMLNDLDDYILTYE